MCQVDFVSKAVYMPTLDGGQTLQAYNSSLVSRDSETRSHYTQMVIGECEHGRSTVARQRDAVAYFKGNEDRRNVFIHRLLHQHAIFDTRSGTLKSRYQFVQTIYHLSYIVLHY